MGAIFNSDTLLRAISEGQSYFAHFKVEGDVSASRSFPELRFQESGVFSGDVMLAQSSFRGYLTIQNIRIQGLLALSDVTLNGNFVLECSHIVKSLILRGANFQGRYLSLVGTFIDGAIDLSGVTNLKGIYVHVDLAERVHWAAPGIPLIVVPNKEAYNVVPAM